jgi:ubiquinone/menaquinone biosynthesis C-methylase UbiE
MSEQPDQNDYLLAGDFFLAVEGLAMMRSVVVQPARARERSAEIRRIVEKFDQFPQSLRYPVTEYDVDAGYTRWAPSYDGPNPAIEAEEPVVEELLAGIAPGVALDAACGTGRHAARLARLGHRVIGVDATEAMLARAREKVPGAEFRVGRLESLPVDDASVDVITCALALTHVTELRPVFGEFARALRPGGSVVTSDIHPFQSMMNGVAAFQSEDGTRGVPYVVNITHQVGEYLDAFSDAGLSVERCIELPVTEETVARMPTFSAYPEATRQAFLGAPYLLLWKLRRSGG